MPSKARRPNNGALVSPLKHEPVYYSDPGYANEGIAMRPDEVGVVTNNRVPAVFAKFEFLPNGRKRYLRGPNPMFCLVEFSRGDKHYRLGLYPDEMTIIKDGPKPPPKEEPKMKLVKLGPNTTELRFTDGATVLISYNTPVAANYRGHFYRTDRKYSVTTSKHITQWLAGANAEERDPSFFQALSDGKEVEV